MTDQEHQNGGAYGTFLLVLEMLTVIAKFWFYIIEHIVKLFTQNKVEKDVKGEVVLITGAAHGMGRETAFEYASQGATIVCVDINEKGNLDTVKQIKTMGGKAFAYVCNVTKKEDVFQLAEKVKKDVGFVSIVINNAGIMPTHPIFDQTENEIKLVYDLNVLAHFWVLQAFVPEMIENKKGHIIALSSCAGLMGVRNLVPYCGTKYAVRGIMTAFYEELRSLGLQEQIKLTTIYPYMVDTGLCKKPRYKFQHMKLVKPQDAAKAIVRAQRRGIQEASIPGHYYYMEKIMNMLPLKAVEVVNDFMDAGVDSDL